MESCASSYDLLTFRCRRQHVKWIEVVERPSSVLSPDVVVNIALGAADDVLSEQIKLENNRYNYSNDDDDDDDDSNSSAVLIMAVSTTLFGLLNMKIGFLNSKLLVNWV